MALPTTTSVNMERKFVPKSGRHPSVRLRYSLLTGKVFKQLGNIRAIVEQFHALPVPVSRPTCADLVLYCFTIFFILCCAIHGE